MEQNWVSGNRFHLLENGEAYFPRVFEAIAQAKREVLLETFILWEDKVGRALHAALLAAAARGARIEITVDAFGTPKLSAEYISSLRAAGVTMHVFDPAPRLLRRINYFRRLHRKLVVVDGERAFIGGINFSADHLADFGPEAKQDYAVEVEGPVVADIRRFMRAVLDAANPERRWFARRAPAPSASLLHPAGSADALFVWRDNRHHRDDIERHYRLAIRRARRRVVIANAYFFPGYLFLRDLRHAARRGVEVALILQGNPDLPIVQTAAAMLYGHLLHGGVRIYEYCERPLHGKVAVVDDDWSTVGSSNLDPLSLALNLEANVIIRDREFNGALGASLHRLMQESCRPVSAADYPEWRLWPRLRSAVLFHVLRRFPAWVGWLPAHAPRLVPPEVAVEVAAAEPMPGKALP